MPDGELAAVFRSLVHEMAHAAERVTTKIAGWTARTADNVRLAVEDAGAADARAEARLKAAAPRRSEDALQSRGDAKRAGPRLPMATEQVEQIAEKYGIDLSGVDVRIDKAKIGFYGSTSPNGAITLTRSAFINEEQLARTLAHERFHVEQIRSGMGYPTDYDSGNAWETAAQQYEDEWWTTTGSGLQ